LFPRSRISGINTFENVRKNAKLNTHPTKHIGKKSNVPTQGTRIRPRIKSSQPETVARATDKRTGTTPRRSRPRAIPESPRLLVLLAINTAIVVRTALPNQDRSQSLTARTTHRRTEHRHISLPNGTLYASL
jgi:hypothetical protein